MVARAVAAVALLLLAGVAGGAGFLAGYEYRGGPSVAPSGAANSTLSILAAGTLGPFFPALASELANETPGVADPSASQTYEGSLEVTTAIAALGARADVAAVADFRLIPQRLLPTDASWEVIFAGTPEVLVYDPSVPAFDGINRSNWAAKLVEDVSTPGNAPLAVWNASTDPNGYNEIFSLELQGMLVDRNASTYYSTFYANATGRPAVPNPSTTRIEKESQAALLLRSGVVSALITYRSYAVANHLTFVDLDPIVGLSSNNSTALSDYRALSTILFGPNGDLRAVSPAPVLFAATVPSDAPNASLGTAFLHLLMSPKGAAVLSMGGAFSPIFPGWLYPGSSVPPSLAPDLSPPPPWVASILD